MKPVSIDARWFDGHQGRPTLVQVWIEGKELCFADQRLHLDELGWPDGFQWGQRQLQLPGRGALTFQQAEIFDAWALQAGRTPGWIDRWQRSAWLATASLMLSALLIAVGLTGGLPWAADWLVRRIPPSAEAPIGEQAMKLLDEQWLRPSELTEAEQAMWRRRFADMLHRAGAQAGAVVPAGLDLGFRRGGRMLGPNAFALPGGKLCVTDELIGLMRDEPDAVLTILAHEVGHVQGRHGLRLAARAAAVTAVAAVWLGDYSSFINGLPALLFTASYSRDHEREADDYARRLTLAAGVDAGRIALFFKRVRDTYGAQDESPLAIAFSSHPADSERVRHFQGGEATR
ncbi:M48 family metallopeptidase [Pelomonas sp. P7]|uniref:M48 family metallopeptidase n=1 Tax=Pelomonas caseinilytica TaxID=2906763 RepID=A0ABS8XMG3_9BURK|nr:M48 family metallopeptidase [Pelomonas sp. P7]MCE4540445.1 M48 family metallopeptidase [Pelomonas sp. P7]